MPILQIALIVFEDTRGGSGKIAFFVALHHLTFPNWSSAVFHGRASFGCTSCVNPPDVGAEIPQYVECRLNLRLSDL